MKELTQSRVRELFDYNPTTGVVTRKASSPGKEVGALGRGRYLTTAINKRHYPLHRIIWLWVYGKFPPEEIDHINHIKDDNRLCNLRSVSGLENHQNQRRYKNNTSGFNGVCWTNREQKWRAQIRHDGRVVCLGEFRDLDDAISCRKSANKKYGYHENHGLAKIS